MNQYTGLCFHDFEMIQTFPYLLSSYTSSHRRRRWTNQHICFRKSISRDTTRPQSWNQQSMLAGEKLKGWGKTKEGKQTHDWNESIKTRKNWYALFSNNYFHWNWKIIWR